MGYSLRRSPLWRILILLPLPYLPLLGFVSGSASWPTRAPAAGTAPHLAFVLAALAAILGMLFVGLTWVRIKAMRVVGYLGYSLVLTAAFGVGGALAMVSYVGGAHGESGGPAWATFVLGAGAVISILGLVPLAALIVAEWGGLPEPSP